MIIIKILRVTGLIILVLMLVLVGVNALGLVLKNERQLSPWGTGFFLIASGSMEPNIPVGSLIFVLEVPVERIRENDVITFFSINELDIVTHRVRSVIDTGSGYVFITRGDANNTDDTPLFYERVIGRVAFSVPGMNALVDTFKNIRYLGIAIIGIGFVLFILGLFSVKKAEREDPSNEE